MAVLATGGDRPAAEGLKRSGGRRIVRFFDLREEAELARWGKKLDDAVAGMRSGRCPNVSSITRPSSEAAHLRERRWQTDPRSRMADLTYAEKDDRWHHAGPQCQGRNRLSQNGAPSWYHPRGLNSEFQPSENRCGRGLRNAPSDSRANPANLARGATHGTNGCTAVQSRSTLVEPPRVHFNDDFRDRAWFLA